MRKERCAAIICLPPRSPRTSARCPSCPGGEIYACLNYHRARPIPLDGLRETVFQFRYHRPSKGAIVLKQKTNVLQGTLDMLVMKTLSWGPQHGYGIALRIQMLSE